MKRQELITAVPVKRITVLLAEDQATFRKSLKLLLELDGDIKLVGEAKNGLEAVRLNTSLHPEVIVMDITMPLLNGLQATSRSWTLLRPRVCSFFPRTPILNTLSKP